MKYLILILFLFISCKALNEIKESKHILYTKTKALRVINSDNNILLLESLPNPARTYIWKNQSGYKTGDTIILTEKIKHELKINKHNETF